MNKKNRLIIFDLDGTLYELDGGSFKDSSLRKEILKNVKDLITNRFSKDVTDAKKILQNIQEKYGEHLSIAFEKEFGMDRYEYFDEVWDIPARDIVKKTGNIKSILINLQKEFEMIILSDAPRVWIMNVLKELDIVDIFKNKIYSGEGDRRKGLNNAFSSIIKDLKFLPEHCIVVGDQENTDIIPAKKISMRAIFVNKKQSSPEADVSISSIAELPEALDIILK